MLHRTGQRSANRCLQEEASAQFRQSAAAEIHLCGDKQHTAALQISCQSHVRLKKEGITYLDRQLVPHAPRQVDRQIEHRALEPQGREVLQQCVFGLIVLLSSDCLPALLQHRQESGTRRVRKHRRQVQRGGMARCTSEMKGRI